MSARGLNSYDDEELAMKKLIFGICAVMLVVFLLFGGGKNASDKDEAKVLSVSEAAFSVRNSKSEDATSFRVGRFAAEDGTRLSFDGQGEVREIATNLVTKVGRCSLTQSDDGAVVLWMDLGGEAKLFTFQLASPEGRFILTDAEGNTEQYTPVL